MRYKLSWKTCLVVIGIIVMYGDSNLYAQSDLKEGNNNFAQYTKTGDFKKLESAKKFSDNAYKESKDSISYKNNLLRALVYSSLAVADSNRILTYGNDPVEEAKFALNNLIDSDLNLENRHRISYIKRKIANAYQIKALQNLKDKDYQLAFDNFKQVDSISGGNIQVKNNLAVLSQMLGQKQEAVRYYKEFMGDVSSESNPKHYLIMSNLYSNVGSSENAVNILKKGLDKYPKNKNVLFELINLYSNEGAYEKVVPLIDRAIALDSNNIELNYLAGYANEMSGNKKLAEYYFTKVISLDKNNYNGNLELGLLYLKDYLNNQREEYKELALTYLLKANEINPSAENALNALAMLFRKAGDTIQYERVQNQLRIYSIN